jgi:hypothetical protein
MKLVSPGAQGIPGSYSGFDLCPEHCVVLRYHWAANDIGGCYI